MSKSITSAQLTNIQQEVTTQCMCVEITRRDGKTYRLTDHDQDIAFEGAVYDAFLPFEVGPIDTGSGGSADNTTLRLFCDETFFKLEDFRRRLFDNAKIKIFYTDYTSPGEGGMVGRTGWFGTMSYGQNKAVEITVIGLMKLLDFQIVRTYSPLCNADLGDSRCGVAIDYGQAYGSRNTYRIGDWVYGYNQASMTSISGTNLGFESDGGRTSAQAITGWTKVGDAYVEVVGAESGLQETEGSWMLTGAPDGGGDGNGYISTVYNDVDVSSLSTDMDDGKLTIAMFFDYATYTNIKSAGRVTLDFIDTNGLILDSTNTGWMFLPTGGEGTWHSKALAVPSVAGTRTVRITVAMYKGDDTEPRVAFDNFAMFYWDHSIGNPHGSVIQKLVNTVDFSPSNDYRVPNGSFESDGAVAATTDPTVSEWTVTGYGQVTDSAHGLTEQHGDYFFAHGDDSGGIQQETTLVQTISLVDDMGLTAAYIDDEKYLIYTRPTVGFGDAGDSEIDIEIAWKNAGDATISTTTYASAYNTGATGWTTFSAGAQVPTLTRSAEITVTLRSPASGAGTASIDNFLLNAVWIDDLSEETTLTGSGDMPLTGSTWASTTGDLTFDGSLVWEALTSHVGFDVVASVTDNKEFVGTAIAGADELYRGGYVRWLSGANAGVKGVVRVWTSSSKTLKTYFETPYDISVGDRFMYVKSCQKRFATDCVGKYKNGMNFRGFPYAPGRLVSDGAYEEVTEQST